MEDTYGFEVDGDRVVARRHANPERTVSLDAKWADGDDVDGDWEAVFRVLLDDAAGAIDERSGALLLDRDRAAEVLASSDADELSLGGRQEAVALLELLARERGLFRFDDDAIVLVQDVREAEDVTGEAALTWALVAEAVAAQLDVLIAEISEVTERHEARIESLDEGDDGYDDIPELLPRLSTLSTEAEHLDSAKVALEMKANEIRTHALVDQQLPEGVAHVLTALPRTFCDLSAATDRTHEQSPEAVLDRLDTFDTAELATQLAGLGTVDDAVENTSPEEFAEMVDDIVDTTEDATAAATETVAEDTTEDGVEPTAAENLTDVADDTTDGATDAATGSVRRNLTPVLQQAQPSSTVEVGASNVGAETDIVELSHRGTTAYFSVDRLDDSPIDAIGTKVRLNENAAELFGGIDRSEPFVLEPASPTDTVPACRSVTISTDDIDPEELDALLRGREYLLHPIDAVVTVDGELHTFDVRAMEPAGYTTLRVTDDTDIEFSGR